MGRKKKTKEIKEVKVSIPTTIKYQGNVNIKLIKRGKVIKEINNHNDGTSQLFKFILDCLAGNYYPINRPTWIIPYYLGKAGGEGKPPIFYAISLFIPINDARVIQQDDDSYMLSYKCLITQTQLAGIQNSINGLLFYSTSNIGNGSTTQGSQAQNYSMIMEFGEPLSELNSDILITWQIKVDAQQEAYPEETEQTV